MLPVLSTVSSPQKRCAAESRPRETRLVTSDDGYGFTRGHAAGTRPSPTSVQVLYYRTRRSPGRRGRLREKQWIRKRRRLGSFFSRYYIACLTSPDGYRSYWISTKIEAATVLILPLLQKVPTPTCFLCRASRQKRFLLLFVLCPTALPSFLYDSEQRQGSLCQKHAVSWLRKSLLACLEKHEVHTWSNLGC